LILLHAINPRLGLAGNSEKEMYCLRGKLRTSGASSLLPHQGMINQRTDQIQGGRVGLTIDMINNTCPIVQLTMYGQPKYVYKSQHVRYCDIFVVSIMDIVSLSHKKVETSKPASLFLYVYHGGKKSLARSLASKSVSYANHLLCTALLYAALTCMLSEL
jgi:hypothetical protein